MLTTVFIALLIVVFVIFAFAMRPTTEQKAVHKRLDLIKSPSSIDGEPIGSELDQLLKASANGRFGWIEYLLRSFSITQQIESLILQSNSKMTVGTLVAWSGGLTVVSFFVTYMTTDLFVVALLVAPVMAYTPLAFLSIRRKRRLNAFNAVLPEAIDTMARSLRAGHSMPAAIGIIAEHASEPIASEFGEVFRKQNFGLPLRDALTQLLDRIPSQDLRVVVTGIMVQKDTGGNLAEVLDRSVYVIRERVRIQGEVRTHTAQGRMTGWILCLLPVVMLGLINLINPGYSKVLLDDPFGRKLMYIGIALLCVGGLCIRNIVNGIEV